MDISHGIPFASPMKIYAGDNDDVADAAIVISYPQGQGKSRERQNIQCLKSISLSGLH